MHPRDRKPCPSMLKREIRAAKKAIGKETRRREKMRKLNSTLGELKYTLNRLREVVPPFGEPSHADD